MTDGIGAIHIFAIGALAFSFLAYSEKDAIRDGVTVKSDAFQAYDETFKKYGTLRNVPWKYLKAIAWIESDLGREPSVQRGILNPDDPDSVSADGLSFGLMQLTLPTAQRSRVRPGTTKRDLNNPELSIDIAARYLSELNRFYFKGEWDVQKESIVRAYNGGPGWQKSGEQSLEQTARYYEFFNKRLQLIQAAHGGTETERG